MPRASGPGRPAGWQWHRRSGCASSAGVRPSRITRSAATAATSAAAKRTSSTAAFSAAAMRSIAICSRRRRRCLGVGGGGRRRGARPRPWRVPAALAPRPAAASRRRAGASASIASASCAAAAPRRVRRAPSRRACPASPASAVHSLRPNMHEEDDEGDGDPECADRRRSSRRASRVSSGLAAARRARRPTASVDRAGIGRARRSAARPPRRRCRSRPRAARPAPRLAPRRCAARPPRAARRAARSRSAVLRRGRGLAVVHRLGDLGLRARHGPRASPRSVRPPRRRPPPWPRAPLPDRRRWSRRALSSTSPTCGSAQRDSSR